MITDLEENAPRFVHTRSSSIAQLLEGRSKHIRRMSRKRRGTARSLDNAFQTAVLWPHIANLSMHSTFGTTYSGCSYSILDPGMVPAIQEVTRYAIRSFSMTNAQCELGTPLNNKWAVTRRFPPSSTTIKRASSVLPVQRPFRKVTLNRPKTRGGPKSNGAVS